MDLIIQPARPDQAGELSRLAQESKRHWGYPDEWLELWRADLTIGPAEIERGGVFLAQLNDELVGWFSLGPAEPNHRLDHLWVAPGRLGRGIGRRMLDRAKAEARDRGGRSLIIDSDPNAEGFYLKMGAKRIGLTPSRPEGRMLPRLELILE